MTVQQILERNAVARAATECHRGHEFTPENTYLRPDGRRWCRTCKLASNRATYRRRRGRQDKIVDEVALERALGGDERVFEALTRAEYRALVLVIVDQALESPPFLRLRDAVNAERSRRRLRGVVG